MLFGTPRSAAYGRMWTSPTLTYKIISLALDATNFIHSFPLHSISRKMLPSRFLRSNVMRSVRMLQQRPLRPQIQALRMSTQHSPQSSSQTTSQTEPPPKGAAPINSNGNPDLGKFSFEGLGLSKNMRIFLIVVLSIFGTMETWFYCKAIYRWWYGEQPKAVE